MSKITNKKYLLLFLGLLLILAFIDLSNLDSKFYKIICSGLGIWFPTVCPNYYDLHLWEVSVAIGTLLTAYYGYSTLKESSRRLEFDQAPHVVLKDRITTAGQLPRLHTMSLKNVGKGAAIFITATTDTHGKISIIDGSNPHSIDLGSGEPNTGWAVDETPILEGLKEQGFNITSVTQGIPDENALSADQKSKADFNVYLWYRDQSGTKYRTVSKIRHSGNFFKVMENSVSKV